MNNSDHNTIKLLNYIQIIQSNDRIGSSTYYKNWVLMRCRQIGNLVQFYSSSISSPSNQKLTKILLSVKVLHNFTRVVKAWPQIWFLSCSLGMTYMSRHWLTIAQSLSSSTLINKKDPSTEAWHTGSADLRVCFWTSREVWHKQGNTRHMEARYKSFWLSDPRTVLFLVRTAPENGEA